MTRAAVVVAVATAAAGAWLALVAVVAAATRARRPDPAPPTMELPGDEPPALVNLLVNGWRSTPAAVPATLLDLAARGHLDVEPAGDGGCRCRLRTVRRPAPLEPYEDMVLAHVRSRATGGVVPCAALTTGPQDASSRWWSAFRKAVAADASVRGLARPRWSARTVGLLSGAAVVPAAAAGVAAAVLQEPGEGFDPGAVVGAGVAVWALLSALLSRLRTQRDTDAGRAAASRWLGLRRFLASHETFASVPPSGVAVWERYLAYGAAMGVAAAAVRGLPLGSQSDRWAWSSYGGSWREVRVRYPDPRRLGWGRRPGVVVAEAVAVLAFGGWLALTILPSLLGALWDAATSPGNPLGLTVLVVVAFGGFAAAIAGALVRAAAMLVLGLRDLGGRVEVTGPVLRVRGEHVAVDDGRGDDVRALVAPSAVRAAGVEQGVLVRALVTPNLRHVVRIEPVAADAPAPRRA
ncbi:MAG TPA: hypothetical protein VHJ34_01035 [Actinomycetota bacterium]|nr:hypothetical protein [Actinomycetota bacterium]